MTSPFDLRVYTTMPTWVIAQGIPFDVEVRDGGQYWFLLTDTGVGGGFGLSLEKDLLLTPTLEPTTYKDRGLIEIHFLTVTCARDWMDEMIDGQLVKSVQSWNRPGSELGTNTPPPVPIKARECCQSFENELHKLDCKDYVTGRGVVGTFINHHGETGTPMQQDPPAIHNTLCDECGGSGFYQGFAKREPCSQGCKAP